MSAELLDHRAAPGVTKPAARSLSQLLDAVAAGDGATVTVAVIIEPIATRSLGLILAFFALLNLIPSPPGTTLVLGLPVVLVAAQFALGRQTVWLPERIARHEISRASIRKFQVHALPWVQRLEAVLKPRYWPFYSQQADRFIGLVCIILGLVIVFPIPFGNAGPALAATILGLALSERDGIWLAAGCVAAILSILLAGSIVATAAWAASGVLHAGG